MNLDKFFKKHPTITCAEDIKEICKPLQDLGVVYFSHANISEQQKMTTLGLRPEFFKLYFEKGYQQYDLHMNAGDPGERFVLWDAVETVGKSSELHNDFICFDQAHTFSIVRSNGKESDCYHFAAKLSDDSMNNKYFNLLGELKKFINYFTDAVNKNKKLKLAYELGVKIDQKTGGYFVENESALAVSPHPQFTSMTETDRLYINKKEYLTKREIECLHWIAQGKTLKEVAMILGVTHRTVKAHVENAKRKLQCRNLFQLGLFYANLYE